MHNPIVHALRPLLAAIVLAIALSACGAAGSPAAPAAPTAVPETAEQRVQGFFSAFNAALNDPELADEARRAELVDGMIGYVAPDEQEAARGEIEGMLTEMTTFDIAALTGLTDLDVRMEINFNITETRLVEEQGDSAQVELVDGNISMKPVGPDVAELGDAAAMLTQELPLSELFSDAGDESRMIDLVKIDGVWYLLDTFE